MIMPERKLPETLKEAREFVVRVYETDEMTANLREAGVAYPDELTTALAVWPVTFTDVADNVDLYCKKFLGGNRRDEVLTAILPPEELKVMQEIFERLPDIVAKFNRDFKPF